MMLIFPELDPIALKVGPLSIYWYGITYLFGFIGSYLLLVWFHRGSRWNAEVLADLLFYTATGIIIGGRFGYILFYQPQEILQNPLTLFAFWLPGRSFHGGLLGVIFAMYIYSRVHKVSWLAVTDCIAPGVPVGLGFGRIGNFMNGELWGKVTDVPWAMVFPHVDSLPRHPSQIYEFILEGIIMCLALLWYARVPRKVGSVSGMFLILYASFRGLVEFVREPDVSHGYIAFDWVTMGHLLCIPMIIIGLFLIIIPERYSR